MVRTQPQTARSGDLPPRLAAYDVHAAIVKSRNRMMQSPSSCNGRLKHEAQYAENYAFDSKEFKGYVGQLKI